MSVLGPVLATVPTAFDDYWYAPRSIEVGGPVDPMSAMTIPQFYAAVAYVSEDIGKVPLNMYEDLGNEGKRPATEHALQERLHTRPNRHQGALEWREMVTAWAMLRGRSVNEVLYGPSTSYPGRPVRAGDVAEIVPLHPDLIREESTGSGDRRWKYADPRQRGRERTILAEDTFVLRGRQSASVLDFASRNLATMISAEKYAGYLFARGARHQGVISTDKVISDPVRTALRKALDEYAIDGPRAGRPLLLEDGMEWHQVSMTARDAQMLEAKHASIEDVCAWIRIPPHKVYNLTRSTNNNISSQEVSYVVDCLLAWAVRWEQAIDRDLVDDPVSYFPKHVLDGLLRGDFDARAKAYALAIMWGWMNRNEVRAKEDLNPLPGLDAPLTPVNMTTDPDGAPVHDLAPRQSAPVEAAAQTLVALPAPVPAVAELGVVGAGQLRLLASDAAARVVRREVAAMTKLAERSGPDVAAWKRGVEDFYADHAEHVAASLHIPGHEAVRYAREQREALIARGPVAMAEWLTDRVEDLVDLAIDASDGAASATPARAPRITVNVPAAQPAAVHIAEGAFQAHLAAAEPPVVHVSVPQAEAPVIHVEVPEAKPRAMRLVRDERGRASGVEEIVE